MILRTNRLLRFDGPFGNGSVLSSCAASRMQDPCVTWPRLGGQFFPALGDDGE